MEQTFLEEKETGSSFDIKNYFTKLLRNFYWFIISIAVFVIAAKLYLRYTIPLYQVSMYIQIKQPTENSNLLGGSPFSSSGANSSMNYSDPNNEIFKLQSAELVGQVVDSLNLDVAVTTYDRVKSKPQNVDSLPFKIEINKLFPDHESPKYKLSLFPTFYKLESPEVTLNGVYGQPLIIQGDTLVLQRNEPFNIAARNTFGLRFLSRSDVITTYVSRLAVVPLPKAGMGILQVALRDEIPRRAKRFIDVLVNRYDIANREFKNQALRVEMDFLNSRLTAVSQELQQQENMVRDFKADNKIYDVSSSANQLLGSLPGIDTKKIENDLKSNLLDLVETNIKSYDGKEEIVPNSSGLQDPVLGDLIARYNQLVLQKSNIQNKGTAQDLRLPGINAQLAEIRSNILKNVENIRREIKTNVSSLSSQERSITGRYQGIPAKEKEFIELNRMLNIKQTLYVFLLQRREDKNIQFASSDVSESRIIDTRLNNSVQDPKPLAIYFLSLIVAVMLPAIIILLKLLLNKKVQSRKDVEMATSLPIAGEIAQAHKMKQEMVITAGARTPIAEQFRTLRTNISYLAHGLSNKVFLITSFKTDEGKSFISLNLANSMAISEKKVVLIEFDLRKPGLAENLDAKNTPGISNYLTGDLEPDQIIRASKEYEHLSFISAGNPLPTNPGELILSSRMEVLFTYLRSRFDIIIIDTPPVGAVSDALTISKWADMSFFIVRHKYSLRSSIKLINQLNEGNKLPQLTLIINGIQDSKDFGYGESYGYGYEYPSKTKKKRKKKSVETEMV